MPGHENVDLMLKGYAAFGAGDMAAVGELLADDIAWHAPGNNPLSGDFEGKDAVFGLFAKTVELTGGTFGQEIHDVLANDEHAVVLVKARGQRPDGRTMDARVIHVWHVSDGKARECWLFADDQAKLDAFWS